MTLRRLLSKLLPAILLFTSIETATAQTDTLTITADSAQTAFVDSITDVQRKYRNYEKRTNWYKKQWAALIPNRFSLQYAGDIGMVSAGIGWCYGKRGQWGTHVFLGYLPKNHTPSSYWSFTVKQVYTPWSLPVGKKLTVEPLTEHSSSTQFSVMNFGQKSLTATLKAITDSQAGYASTSA